MLRLDYPEIQSNQISLIETLLPAEAIKLPPDLEKVDQILKDERFVEPFIERFNVTIGRGTVPVNPYLRLMVLKHTNQWGYETLEYQVNQNLVLKKFCRIPLDKACPDNTTLIKLNQKYGEDVLKDLNKKLMRQLTERKIIRGRKLNIDTTVVESNIHFPTDAGLLKDCVDAIAKATNKAKTVSDDATKDFRSGTRKIKNQLLKVVKVLRKRTGESKKEVKAVVDEMVKTVKDAHKAGQKVMNKVKNNSGKQARKIVQQIEEILNTTAQIIQQTEDVQSGNVHLEDRIISIYDKEARPIKKGKLGVKAEFGYKVQIEECEKGFVPNYEVYKGNPSDDKLLDGALKRHKDTFGASPNALATDRGYGSKANEDIAKGAGVKKIAIPRRGKKSKERTELEKSRWFKELKRWRAGIEARISLLKRKYGLDKSSSRGYKGICVCIGWGILSYNLINAVKHI